MNRLEVDRADWQPPAPVKDGTYSDTGKRFTYLTEPPADAHVVTGDTIITDRKTGSLVCVSARLDGRTIHSGSLLELLPETQWTSSSRTSGPRLRGFNNAMRTFGTTAPQPVRQRYGCSACVFQAQYPLVSEYLADASREMWRLFQTAAPEEADTNRQLVTSLIHRDWFWAGTPWTSGVINETAALPYHRDSGNVPGAWSAQLNLRRDVTGGLLHLPEYGIYLPCESRSAIIFPGQNLWHGVTPISPTAPLRAHRYSIVLYTKHGCRHCGPGADEPRRAAKLRTIREGLPA